MSLPESSSPLDRARSKAFFHLLPLLFFCYVIAYVDRVNVSLAKLNMQKDLAHLGFSEESAFGFGMGVFFVGYLLLAIPGTLVVERWSARKWISWTMIFWGVIAATTAFVHYWVPGASAIASWIVRATATLIDPLAHTHLGWFSTLAQELADHLRGPGAVYVFQFWAVRFLLGVAEAGFYPGVIVYLTHWFPRRDRSRALAWFFIGTPIAQIIGPPICGALMTIGTGDHPPILSLVGWQWVYIFWGAPAVILGFLVLARLPDWPHEARWLDERRAHMRSKASCAARNTSIPPKRATCRWFRPWLTPRSWHSPWPTSSWSPVTTASRCIWRRSSTIGTTSRFRNFHG